MTFWQWLNGNWVKVLGSIGALNSALIAATAGGMFAGLVEETTIKWLAIVGFFMNAWLVSVGYRNTTQEKVADAKAEVANAMQTAIQATPGTPPKQGGFARVIILFFLSMCAGAMCAAIVTGCAGTKAAYSEASDYLPDTAYVVAEHYAALVKEAADLRQQPGTPQSAIAAMQAADRIVKPFILGDPSLNLPGLQTLAETYQAVKDAKTEADLQEAINRAVRELSNFSKAVKAARGRT